MRGGLARRRGLSESQSGSRDVSIRLFLLILNCSHWKTVTSSSHVFTINPAVVREGLFSPGEKDETGEELPLSPHIIHTIFMCMYF